MRGAPCPVRLPTGTPEAALGCRPGPSRFRHGRRSVFLDAPEAARVTVIALEGASAVGKTTAAERLCEAFDAHRVPEVNERFERPERASATWYFERQCDRWRMATDRESDCEVVVLDGDVLQPLWYNWIARHLSNDRAAIEEFAPPDAVYRFYRERMSERAVGFPDRYFLLHASEEALRRRKADDETRTRRNFESHLRFAEPQRAYFERLRTRRPEMVRSVPARSVESTVSEIASAIPRAGDSPDRYAPERPDALFDWVSESRTDGRDRRDR